MVKDRSDQDSVRIVGCNSFSYFPERVLFIQVEKVGYYIDTIAQPFGLGLINSGF